MTPLEVDDKLQDLKTKLGQWIEDDVDVEACVEACKEIVNEYDRCRERNYMHVMGLYISDPIEAARIAIGKGGDK